VKQKLAVGRYACIAILKRRAEEVGIEDGLYSIEYINEKV